MVDLASIFIIFISWILVIFLSVLVSICIIMVFMWLYEEIKKEITSLSNNNPIIDTVFWLLEKTVKFISLFTVFVLIPIYITIYLTSLLGYEKSEAIYIGWLILLLVAPANTFAVFAIKKKYTEFKYSFKSQRR